MDRPNHDKILDRLATLAALPCVDIDKVLDLSREEISSNCPAAMQLSLILDYATGNASCA